MHNRRVLPLLAAVLSLQSFAQFPSLAVARETRFTIIDSSPSSWVARGYDNYTVTPDDGWTFALSGSPGDGLASLYLSGTALPGTSVDYWRIEFKAPSGTPLVPGLYPDFQRYPFQDFGRPGLSFSSTGRLDNQAAGFFEILEISVDPSNKLLSFAADFTHYGETQTSGYAIVEVRYNALVPEPGGMSLSLTVFTIWVCRRRGFTNRGVDQGHLWKALEESRGREPGTSIFTEDFSIVEECMMARERRRFAVA